MITSCITISNNLSLTSGTEGKEDVILSRLTLGKLNLFFRMGSLVYISAGWL